MTETSHSLEGKYVLIVVDLPINLKLNPQFLKSFKMDIDTAEDGPEAVYLTKNLGYIVILIDIQMPTIERKLAMQEIQKFHPNLPIIALKVEAVDYTRDDVSTTEMKKVS